MRLSTIGCALCGAVRSASNEAIDKELKMERSREARTVKILLLGTADSGKSTIVKQMKNIYIAKSEMEELQVVTFQVFQNLRVIFFEIARVLLKTPIAEDSVEIISRFASIEPNDIDVDWGVEKQFMKEFSTNRYVTEFMISNQYHNSLPDNSTYFWGRIEAALCSDFVASETDSIHLRTPTYGIHEIKFNFKLGTIRLIDVGGQRAERRKWIHCFEGVTAVMFVASISSYDQVLEECSSTNRLAEAIALFQEVFRNRWLSASGFLLFLNKFDIFEKKIKHSDISLTYPEYAGGPTVNLAAEFVLERFTSKLEAEDIERRGFHAHFTTAVDPENIDFVFKGAVDIIMNRNLYGTGMM